MHIARVEHKNRTREEVLKETTWLTGHTHKGIEVLLKSDTTYGDYFHKEYAPNPNRKLIKGSICDIEVEQIKDPGTGNQMSG